MAKTKKAKNNSKKSTSRRGYFWRFSLVLLLIGLGSFVFMLSQSLLKTYPVVGKHKLLMIQNGQTYTGFIKELKDKKIIRFEWLAKAYQKFFIHESLKAGVYQIDGGMPVWKVLRLLSDANNAQMNRIMLIEGTTFKQLIQKLKADPNVVARCSKMDTAQLLKQIGATQQHPEGLFAPNTYFFAKGEEDCQILKTLYQKQQKILAEAWQAKAKDLPYKNAYEALIMASIIEKETALDKEREQVAGVFVRRLKVGMRLQTDPTVIYGMGDRYNGNIRRKDLLTPTDYNTYTIYGLPPTPIALPSERSIYAALHPDQSNTLYFVANGQGGHTFSATLEQHNRAVAAYLKTLKKK